MESFGNCIPDNDTQFRENLNRDLTAMFKRTFNQITQDVSKNERNNQYLPHITAMNVSPAEPRKDTYNQLPHLQNPRLQMGLPTVMDKTAIYTTNPSNRLPSQDFSMPNGFLVPRNDSKEDKLVNTEISTNTINEASTLDVKTQQMQQLRQTYPMAPTFPLNIAQQTPQTHQMASNQQTQETRPRIQANAFDPFKHMPQFAHLQKLNQTPQMAQNPHINRFQQITPNPQLYQVNPIADGTQLGSGQAVMQKHQTQGNQMLQMPQTLTTGQALQSVPKIQNHQQQLHANQMQPLGHSPQLNQVQPVAKPQQQTNINNTQQVDPNFGTNLQRIAEKQYYQSLHYQQQLAQTYQVNPNTQLAYGAQVIPNYQQQQQMNTNRQLTPSTQMNQTQQQPTQKEMPMNQAAFQIYPNMQATGMQQINDKQQVARPIGTDINPTQHTIQQQQMNITLPQIFPMKFPPQLNASQMAHLYKIQMQLQQRQQQMQQKPQTQVQQVPEQTQPTFQQQISQQHLQQMELQAQFHLQKKTQQQDQETERKQKEQAQTLIQGQLPSQKIQLPTPGQTQKHQVQKSPKAVSNEEAQRMELDLIKNMAEDFLLCKEKKVEPVKVKRQRRRQVLKKSVSEKQELKPDPIDKLETESLNLNPTVSSTPANNSIPDNSKKAESKKHTSKSYEELISLIQCLSKFDWLEENNVYKFAPIKALSPAVVWFLICSEYFPRRMFANKDVKKAVQETFEKIRNLETGFMQRIATVEGKPESNQKYASEDFESLFIMSLSHSIKYYGNKILHDSAKISSNAPNLTPIVKSEYTEEDDQWIMETRRYIYDSFKKLQDERILPVLDYDVTQNLNLLSRIDLEDVITLYEKDLYDLVAENEKNKEELEKKILGALEEEELINSLEYDAEDIIADIKLTFPEDEKSLALVEKKRNETKTNNLEEKPVSSRQEGVKTAQKCRAEAGVEDTYCQICNDEEFTDDNLIVFCSKCNISVHQRCYGIPVIPEGDWICDLCINFKASGKYLRCPLCSKRGGAMKPSTTRADIDFFQYLNPDYHAFLTTCVNSESYMTCNDKRPLSFRDLRKKRQLSASIDFLRSDEELPEIDFHEKLYYDYYKVDEEKFTEEELKSEPKPCYVWAHITCAQFIPELSFSDRVRMTDIQGIEDIETDRFKYECDVCKKKRNGATVECERKSCKKAFHPECARRAKHYMDARENNINQLIYYIYCDKHTPLQLKRILEGKEKKKRDEINKFFKAVEKCYLSNLEDSQPATAPLNSRLFASMETSSMFVKKRKSANTPTSVSTKDDGAAFLKLVDKYRVKTSKTPCTIILEKIANLFQEDMENYNIVDITPPMSKNRELLESDAIWKEMPWKGMSPAQKYKKYKKLMKEKQKKKEEKKIEQIIEQIQMNEGIKENEMSEENNQMNENNETTEMQETKPKDDMHEMNEVNEMNKMNEEAKEEVKEAEEMNETTQENQMNEMNETYLAAKEIDDTSEGGQAIKEGKETNETKENIEEVKDDENNDSEVSETDDFKAVECKIGIDMCDFSEDEPAPIETDKSEFQLRFIKQSYLRYLANNSSILPPFDYEYLATSLVVDDITSNKETPICCCRKPYRGEIMLTCNNCKEMYHPKCVDLPVNIDPESVKWVCQTCCKSQSHPDENWLETEYTESLTSLIGKRPSSSESEDEPNPKKKINLGLKNLNYC